MTLTRNQFDVTVLGGGAAGSAAARLLASWGHAVHLVTRPAADARLAVSLPPSCSKLFDAVGVTGAIAQAQFIRSTGNTVWWGTEQPRVEMFAGGGRGWQVETHVLEAAMLAEAGAAGVSIERRTISDADLTTALPGGSEDPPLRFVLDCTGRAGVVARARGLRQYDPGPRTIALVGAWRRDPPWPVPDDTHTLVESYETGWAWSVPVASPQALPPSPRLRWASKPSGPLRHIAVMVDPQRSGLARDVSAMDVYLTEIAKTLMFRDLTAAASLHAGPWGWDASTYQAEHYAGDGWLLAGDAGSFIDPLSSAGVKKALASGWLAAIVAHTCMTRPAMRQHALSFYSSREADLVTEHARASRRFLSEAAPSHRHRFWSDRADEQVIGVGATGSDREGRAVRAAFEQLRSATAIQLRRNPTLRIDGRPAVQGNEIVLEPRIVAVDDPGGIRHLRDIDLLALIELAPLHTQVPDLFEAYCRRLAPVALPDFLFVLATALARGWLVA